MGQEVQLNQVANIFGMLLSAKTISDTNLTLSGVQNINGHTGAENDRVFVNAQTNPLENGMYVMISGAWYRDGDFEVGDHPGKTLFMITSGNEANKIYEIENTVDDTVGTNAYTAKLSDINPGGSNTDYYAIACTQTNTDFAITDNSLLYKGWAQFIFPGTDNIQQAITARAIVWVDASSKKADFRIRDITNGNTIVEILDIDNEDPAIIEILNTMNAPTAPAIFEVQLRTQQTGGKYNMSGFAFGTNT
jgi:hypothetical protein